MNSFEQFVTLHPYFSMTIIHGMKRLNRPRLNSYLNDLEFALQEQDIACARDIVQKLKAGFHL